MPSSSPALFSGRWYGPELLPPRDPRDAPYSITVAVYHGDANDNAAPSTDYYCYDNDYGWGELTPLCWTFFPKLPYD